MPERSSPMGGDQPLARPVGDEPLAKAVGGQDGESSSVGGETRAPAGDQQPSPQTGETHEGESREGEAREESHGEEEEKGFLDKIKGKLTGG